jgi:hypothetical protein
MATVDLLPSLPPEVVACSPDTVAIKLARPLVRPDRAFRPFLLAAAASALAVGIVGWLSHPYATPASLVLLFLGMVAAVVYYTLVEATLVASRESDVLFVERSYPFLHHKSRELLCQRNEVREVRVVPSALADDTDVISATYLVQATTDRKPLTLWVTSNREPAEHVAACLRQICNLRGQDEKPRGVGEQRSNGR